ncbi:MAG: aminoacyl-tRNA deacylase [Thermoproteota archaeon]
MSRKKLADFLKVHKVDADIIDTGDETASVISSSEVLGISRKRILKSIVFQSNLGTIIALVRGDQRVSEKKLAGVVGAQKVQLAKAEKVRETTGYHIGGVPPVGHAYEQNMIYVLDQELLQCDKVYAGGGDSRSQLNIKIEDIIRLVTPKLADISE